MKFKTTQKAIKESYSKIVKVGYCNLQSLLNFKTPVAYTCGGDGWHADIYDINGVAIVTGYQPFGNIKADYDVCRKYEIKAEKLRYSNTNFKKREKQLSKMINKFIEEVTK